MLTYDDARATVVSFTSVVGERLLDAKRRDRKNTSTR
jgi:hypothetical protein